MEADVRTASDEAPVPGAAIEGGVNVAEAPLGRPETERATRALKPPEAVAVTVVDAVPPGAVEIAGGATVREMPRGAVAMPVLGCDWREKCPR